MMRQTATSLLLLLALVPAAMAVRRAWGGAPKFVFVAGLEGTGHHLIGQVLKHCGEKPKCSEPPHDCKRIFDLMFEGNEVSVLAKQLRKEAASASSEVVLLNTWPGNGLNMMSYPDGPAGKHSPKLSKLDEAARQADAPLRVVVLTRSVEAMLRDGCQYHSYAPNCTADVERLTKHGNLLYHQLTHLDPETRVFLSQVR